MLKLQEMIRAILALTDFELRKMFRRRVAHAGIAVSLFLTFLGAVGISMKMSRRPDKKLAGRLISEMMNGLAFSETILLPGIYMILPMVVGIFAAASFAGEYQNGYLRTIAIRPISRWQIILSKFTALAIYSYILLGILFVVSYSTGALLFGVSGDVIVFGPAFLGQGSQIFIMQEDTAWVRLILSYTFAGFALISLSAMFLMFSAIFKKTAIAIVCPLGIYYTSYILDAIPFMESLQVFLPTRYLMLWKYVMAENIKWDLMMHDGIFLLLYTVTYLVVAAVVFEKAEL